MPRDQLRAVAEDYDRRSDRWERVYSGGSLHDSVIQQRLQAALAALSEQAGGAVLDVGCGAGQLVSAVAGRGRPGWGCDISHRQLQLASRRLSFAVTPNGAAPAALCRADAAALPFVSQRFAGVTALGCIQYLTDPTAGVAEMARVARPGGTVVATAPNLLRLSILLDPLGALRQRLHPQHSGYRRRLFTRRGFRRLLERSGLRVVRIDGVGFGPLSVLGWPLMTERAAVRLDAALRRSLPVFLASALGSELVAVATPRDPPGADGK
ncbi:MAG TPA: methyltransferase domain-containing protein [Acidimicrobiales bacterium]|nr:methyltransferase domain-containing protein [Acidimicrobiales bacterium]